MKQVGRVDPHRPVAVGERGDEHWLCGVAPELHQRRERCRARDVRPVLVDGPRRLGQASRAPAGFSAPSALAAAARTTGSSALIFASAIEPA